MNPFTFHIVGASGHGKTTVIETLIPILVEQGLSIGVVKHGPHDFDFDKPGKDTWRFTKSGARLSAIEGDGQVGLNATLSQKDEPWEFIERFASHLDIVIIEGYKTLAGPKIEVIRDACGQTPCCTPTEGVVAYVTDLTAPLPAPSIGLSDSLALAELLLERYRAHGSRPRCLLSVGSACQASLVEINEFIATTLRRVIEGLLHDIRGCSTRKGIRIILNANGPVKLEAQGELIPLKPFLHDMIGNTLRGCIAALKDIETGQDLIIELPPE